MFHDIEVVLFDVGGTLVDFPVPGWPAAASRCLEGMYGYLVHSEDQWPPPAASIPDSAEAQSHRPRPAPGTALLHRVTLALRRVIRSASGYTLPRLAEACARPLVAEGRRFEDTLPTLRALRGRGYRLGVISNTPWGTPDYLWSNQLERFGLAEYFEACLFSSAIGYRKPDARIFKMALARLAASPAQAVFIGDDPKADILGARLLGLRTVLLRRRGCDKAPSSTEADACIESLKELLDLLPPQAAGLKIG